MLKSERHKRPKPPLDRDGLDRLALFYVGRYATTQAKLSSYLQRKLRERGWSGSEPANTESVIGRLAELGYVDDRAYAAVKGAALQRRGFGERRLRQALQAAGVASADSEVACEQAHEAALKSALRFAERRRLGPYAAEALQPDVRRKAFAAMVRAGHPFDIVRYVLNAAPGMIPELDGL